MITIVFDTETTGLLKPSAVSLDEQPQIIELYAVKLDDDFNIIGEFESLFKPILPIEPIITEITGIKQEQLDDAPSFAQKFDEIAELFTGADRMVAHNCPFDRDMLANDILRIDKILRFPWPRQHVCTVRNSMSIEQRRLTLTRLHQYATGKPLEEAHRAKQDVFGLVRCYHWLLEKKMIKSV